MSSSHALSSTAVSEMTIQNGSPGQLWTLLAQGAECRLWTGFALNRRLVRKERFVKEYRNASLDERLTKERTRAEVRALIRLKERSPTLGPLVPTIYFVSDREIVMDQLVAAQTVSQFSRQHSFQECGWLYELLGTTIALVHQVGIIHGDLTTTNFMLTGNQLALIPIDFGLASFSESDEDRAVDLYVLERSLLINDIEHYAGLTQILDAYCAQMGSERGSQVMGKLEDVRQRGRKKSMVG